VQTTKKTTKNLQKDLTIFIERLGAKGFTLHLFSEREGFEPLKARKDTPKIGNEPLCHLSFARAKL
jgi:hypothetical protein